MSDPADTFEAAQEDGSLFGRPLFEDPSARALSRVGVVDVGSNSVRMVVFDGAARSPAYFYNEKVMAGLGKGLAETGRLNPEGAVRALAALKRFALLAEGMGISPLSVVATAAVREAEDGPAFQDQVLRETGLRIFVIDGDEEARLSAQGVLLGWPDAKGIVCDIGGNSMELARVGDGKVGKRVSTQLGPFRLQQVEGGVEKRRDRRCWPAASTWMAKWLAPWKSQTLGAWRARLHSTSGGSSETEENELAVMPTRRPSGARVVMTVTPVVNWPKALRSSRGSKEQAVAAAGVSHVLMAASAARRGRLPWRRWPRSCRCSGLPRPRPRTRGRRCAGRRSRWQRRWPAVPACPRWPAA